MDDTERFDASEHVRRQQELERFGTFRLREPEAFPDTEPTEEQARRLGRAKTAARTGPGSRTVSIRLSRSCAGWQKAPSSGEFYEAIRAEAPSERQRAILGVFAREGDWQDFIAAWAERAYTLRALVAALHRAGHAECHAARWLNGCASNGHERAR